MRTKIIVCLWLIFLIFFIGCINSNQLKNENNVELELEHKLSQNIIENESVNECFGKVDYTVCSKGICCNQTCVSGECCSDEACNDNNPNTVDKCLNYTCVNIPISNKTEDFRLKFIDIDVNPSKISLKFIVLCDVANNVEISVVADNTEILRKRVVCGKFQVIDLNITQKVRKIDLILDPSNEVKETNEDNNVFTRVIEGGGEQPKQEGIAILNVYFENLVEGALSKINIDIVSNFTGRGMIEVLANNDTICSDIIYLKGNKQTYTCAYTFGKGNYELKIKVSAGQIAATKIVNITVGGLIPKPKLEENCDEIAFLKCNSSLSIDTLKNVEKTGIPVLLGQGIIAVVDASQVYFYNSDLALINKYSIKGEAKGAVSCDINGDGKDEVLVYSDDNLAYFDGVEQKWAKGICENIIYVNCEEGEIVVVCEKEILVLTYEGEIKNRVSYGGTFAAKCNDKIIVGDYGKITAMDSNGNILWVKYFAIQSPIDRILCLNDKILAFSTKEAIAYVFTYDGSLVASKAFCGDNIRDIDVGNDKIAIGLYDYVYLLDSDLSVEFSRKSENCVFSDVAIEKGLVITGYKSLFVISKSRCSNVFVSEAFPITRLDAKDINKDGKIEIVGCSATTCYFAQEQ